MAYNKDMDTRKSSAKAGPNSINPSSLGAKATPELGEGPFYMPGSPENPRLFEERIPGDKLTLTGSVLDIHGKPIPRAWLDFWQANGEGDYDNLGYTLRGHQYTDKSGKYVLETVVPGAYAVRTPHIHVKVRTDDNGPIFTTQLFIPGLASNKTDFLYRDDLQMNIKNTPSGKKGTFDFILKV
jgi:protocatechuate 3,4-dioxygenase beta subunit